MPLVLIKKGAEANLYLVDCEEFLGYGKGKLVIKERVRKKYRLPEIDYKLRKSRILSEAKILHHAKMAGVPTPSLKLIDLENMRLAMEYIDGKRLKELLGEVGKKERERLCNMIGVLIARLHRAGIVHGDLTTSNMIYRNGRIYLIDFGLSEFDSSLEGRGVDLHLCRRALESAHSTIAKECFRRILEGYRRELGKEAAQVILKAEEISKRGRYIPKEERVWH